MEIVGLQVDLRQFVVGDYGALGIGLRVQLTADFEPGLGGGCGNQVHDDFVADQRFATPVWLMYENRRCSILFHLLVPGGK